MKNKIIILSSVLATMSFASCEKETLIAGNDVPGEMKSYIAAHFPDTPVSQVIKDKDGFSLTYNIMLSDLTKLEFNRKKEITDIESQTKLPDSVIPGKILKYVNDNYSGQEIRGWELDDKHQQVELKNGLELEFKMNGDFSRISN